VRRRTRATGGTTGEQQRPVREEVLAAGRRQGGPGEGRAGEWRAHSPRGTRVQGGPAGGERRGAGITAVERSSHEALRD
jgi:hypothetical protein